MDGELAALLRAALAGNESAYTTFLGEAARLVRVAAHSRISHSVDAEDIVQETLLAIHLKRHTWRPDCPVIPWIMAIARHKLVDAFRARGKRFEIDIDDLAELPAEPMRDVAVARDVSRALDALPPGQRRVVSAIAIEGHSISEAAKSLSMGETAIRVAFHRGLAAIARRRTRG